MVSPRGEVHGIEVGVEEVVVQLDEVKQNMDHPIHQYPLEKGSYTAWRCDELVLG